VAPKVASSGAVCRVRHSGNAGSIGGAGGVKGRRWSLLGGKRAGSREGWEWFGGLLMGYYPNPKGRVAPAMGVVWRVVNGILP